MYCICMYVYRTKSVHNALQSAYHATIGDDVMAAVINRQNTLNTQDPPTPVAEDQPEIALTDDAPATPCTPVPDDEVLLNASATAANAGGRAEAEAEAGSGAVVDDVKLHVLEVHLCTCAYVYTLDIQKCGPTVHD
jgi:hypothetical protein